MYLLLCFWPDSVDKRKTVSILLNRHLQALNTYALLVHPRLHLRHLTIQVNRRIIHATFSSFIFCFVQNSLSQPVSSASIVLRLLPVAILPLQPSPHLVLFSCTNHVIFSKFASPFEDKCQICTTFCTCTICLDKDPQSRQMRRIHIHFGLSLQAIRCRPLYEVT